MLVDCDFRALDEVIGVDVVVVVVAGFPMMLRLIQGELLKTSRIIRYIDAR